MTLSEDLGTQVLIIMFQVRAGFCLSVKNMKLFYDNWYTMLRTNFLKRDDRFTSNCYLQNFTISYHSLLIHTSFE